MKSTMRLKQDRKIDARRKQSLNQHGEVRPLTSQGHILPVARSTSSNDKKRCPPAERPKTALGLRQKQTNQLKLASTDNPVVKARPAKPRPERFTAVIGQRNRSISLPSGSTETLPARRKPRTRSQTVSTVIKDIGDNPKQKRFSIQPTTRHIASSKNNHVQRKVAWQADTKTVDLHELQISTKEELCGDGQTQQDDVKAKVDDEKEEIVKDMFHPPDLTSGESDVDYETELEDHAPVPVRNFDSSGQRTYLKLCKKEDVLPVSGLTKQFTEKEMVIRHRGLGWKGTKTLANSLAKNVYIEKLDLADNYMECVGASFVSCMLVDNCYITQLDLSQNFIGAEGGINLADMLLTNQVLRKLVLRANHLTDRVAKQFAATLRENRTLWHLDMSHNEIGEHGAVYLGAGLALNYGLKYLDLSWNCIRGKGGVAIVQALKTNDSLTTLNLSWNGISLLGCVALGRFLRRNENLRELDLGNNRIGYLGAQRMCRGISKNSSLEVLKVGRNPLGDDGVEALLKAVKSNKSLKLLSMEDVTVSATVYRDIQQLEQERGIKIITGGLGGYKKPKEMPQRMAVLLDFIKVNRLRLVDWFFQFDKDRSGDISKDEFKLGLKETGLKMTAKQLDSLIEYLDVDNNGKIEFRTTIRCYGGCELLVGRDHTLQEQRDFRMFQQNLRKMENMRARLPTIEGFEPE